MSSSITLATNAHLALIKTHRFRSLPDHLKELLTNELKKRKLNSLEIAALASETEAFALFENKIETCPNCQQRKYSKNQIQKLGLLDFHRDDLHCVFCNRKFQISSTFWKRIKSYWPFFETK